MIADILLQLVQEIREMRIVFEKMLKEFKSMEK